MADPGSESGHDLGGEVVIDCVDLQAEVDFLIDHAGFRLHRVLPSDDPRLAVVVGHGVRLALRRSTSTSHRVELRLPHSGGGATPLTTPAGTRITWGPAPGCLTLPDLAPATVVSRAGDPACPWHDGRAGMRYRDLLPGRYGGRFVASHIHTPAGGPVRDLVHHHQVRLQLILGLKGWVRVAYEDQGEPLVLRPGQVVLQPPGIRHQVLESSPGMEVLELACPAAHDTWFDHALALPNPPGQAKRSWTGQQFVHAIAPGPHRPWRQAGFQARAMGIADAAAGQVEVMQVRRTDGAPGPPAHHDGELSLLFVAAGSIMLHVDGRAEPLHAHDAASVPAGCPHRLADASTDLRLWEILVANLNRADGGVTPSPAPRRSRG